MIRLLHTEFLKLKHKYILLTATAMIGFQIIWLLFASYRHMDSSTLAVGWISNLYQFPLLNTLLLPTFLALLASRISDVEHRENTFKNLLLYQSGQTLFTSKAMCGIVIILLMHIIQFSFMLLCGYLFHFTDTFKGIAYMQYFITTFLVSLTIFLLQLDLSLYFSNQVIPFIVGLSGSMFGIVLMLMPWHYQAICPWGGYISLIPVLIEWNEKTQTTSYYYTAFGLTSWINLLLVCIWLVALWFLGRHLLSHLQL